MGVLTNKLIGLNSSHGCHVNTRRRFLASSALTVFAISHPGLMLGQQADKNVFSGGFLGAFDQGLMTQGNFEKQLGSLFMMFLDDQSVSYMRLISVMENKPPTVPVRAKASGRTAKTSEKATPIVVSFTARFKADKPLEEQGSYVIDHGTLGRFTLFLVPGIDEAGAPTCSAVFSRLQKA